MDLIEACAARTLKPFCANYRDVSHDPAALTHLLPPLSLQEGEMALGLYENHPGLLQEAILVTDRGFHIHWSPRSVFVAYHDITTTGP